MSDGIYGYVYQINGTTTRETGSFFVIESASSIISDPTFTGSGDGAGLNDMSTAGDSTRNTSAKYVVEIDSTTETFDTFRWSDTGGASWNRENVTITAALQLLNDGVQVQFAHRSDHTKNDKWTFDVTTDSAFYVPIIPAYQDTYGIYVRQDTNRWYLSKEDDFSLVNALEFAKVNAWPDDLIAAVSINEEIWLICRNTTELWYDVGSDPFPFERRQNLIIKYGCAAPYSISVIDNNILFWLGGNQEGGRCVIMLDGYSAKIISTEAINEALQSYEEISDAIGFPIQWNGHLWYCLILPSANVTWIYDLTTDAWHQRVSVFPSRQPATKEKREGRWRANCHAYFDDKHLVGDFENGNIYQLTDEEYTENGEMLPCERITQHINSSLNRLCMYDLEVDIEKGTALLKGSGQGENPQFMLQVSKDGGKVWGDERWLNNGLHGQYNKRLKWNGLGTARVFTFRLRVTDPVYRTLMGSVANIENLGS
jgi:hypothetical protein